MGLKWDPKGRSSTADYHRSFGETQWQRDGLGNHAQSTFLNLLRWL